MKIDLEKNSASIIHINKSFFEENNEEVKKQVEMRNLYIK